MNNVLSWLLFRMRKGNPMSTFYYYCHKAACSVKREESMTPRVTWNARVARRYRNTRKRKGAGERHVFVFVGSAKFLISHFWEYDDDDIRVGRAKHSVGLSLRFKGAIHERRFVFNLCRVKRPTPNRRSNNGCCVGWLLISGRHSYVALMFSARKYKYIYIYNFQQQHQHQKPNRSGLIWLLCDQVYRPLALDG